jgi:hypothetical protein
MSQYIKALFICAIFFSTINLSYGQSAKPQDTTQQSSTADTAVQENNTDENMVIAGDSSGASTGSYGSATQETYTQPAPPTNTYQPERVNGTRAPNEYSSGRSGGQYNHPKPVLYKKPAQTTTPPPATGNGGAGQTGSETGNGQ